MAAKIIETTGYETPVETTETTAAETENNVIIELKQRIRDIRKDIRDEKRMARKEGREARKAIRDQAREARKNLREEKRAKIRATRLK